MRFGVQLGVDAPVHPDALTELALGAERLRFESFWVGDHFVIPQAIDDGAHRRDVGGTQRFADRSRASIAEPVTTLCYLAATVRRLRLGLAVLVVPLRNPVQSAKMLANLDVLSGGRLDIGIGSGWIEAEFEALRTPPFADRGRVTDEYLDLMIELWAADDPSFKGEYYEIRGVTMYPKPVQRPHPPLWVGAMVRVLCVGRREPGRAGCRSSRSRIYYRSGCGFSGSCARTRGGKRASCAWRSVAASRSTTAAEPTGPG